MNNTTQEKTEEQYQTEFNLINEMFSDAKFNVSIDIDELDDVLSTEKTIVVKQTFTCHCYSNCNKHPSFYIIRGETMSQKYVIQELINQKFKIECDHQFIEGFDKLNETQFEVAGFS